MVARAHISQGGLSFAQQLLEQSLGPERASEMIARLNAAAIQMPFQFLHRADAAQLRSFIIDEHPQVIALVLAHMTPDKASLLLSGFSPEYAGRRRAPDRRHGPHVAGDHPGRRVDAGAPAVLDAAARRELARRRPRAAGQHHQPLRPLHGASDRRGPRGARPRAGRRDQVRRCSCSRTSSRWRTARSSWSCARSTAPSWRSRSRASPRRSATRSPRTCPSALPTNLIEEVELLGTVRLRQVEEAQQNIIRIIRRLEEQGQIMVRQGGR